LVSGASARQTVNFSRCHGEQFFEQLHSRVEQGIVPAIGGTAKEKAHIEQVDFVMKFVLSRTRVFRFALSLENANALGSQILKEAIDLLAR